jgi:hypothetical protein
LPDVTIAFPDFVTKVGMVTDFPEQSFRKEVERIRASRIRAFQSMYEFGVVLGWAVAVPADVGVEGRVNIHETVSRRH